jgi:hypothetical protein
MNSIPSVSRALGAVAILLALSAFGEAQAGQPQIAAPAAIPAQNSFCGSQPLCYETADFAATVTDFRTSSSGGLKLIDVDLRFQNKTNQPLILGYVANSGTALDDRGNRYGVWGPNGFRGIGVVYGGNNFDPKFNIRAGSYADAQFELAWNPGQTPYGLTFELNLSVDEINSIEAGQHTLGGEFPLHYRGLANGIAGNATGQGSAYSSQGQGVASSIPGLPPCSATATTLTGAANSAGVQVPASANNTVSNASAAFSSLGSLFGKKKAATPATATTQNTASTAPCAPATTGVTTSGVATPATTSMSSGNAAVPQGSAALPQGATGVTSQNATAPGAVTKASAVTVMKAPAPAPAATNATVKKAVPPPPPPKKATPAQ